MQETKCPFGFDKPKHTKAGSRNNSSWWPDQLNLKILHQNSSITNPMDDNFDYAKEFKSLDLEELKNYSLAAKNQNTFDSYMRVFLNSDNLKAAQ